MKISDVAAVVTGGASGLGEAVVRGIVAQGGRAAILDIDEDRGARLARELGGAALFCKTDVSDEQSVSAAIKRAIDTFGRINVAVNSAGIAVAGKTVGKKGPMDLKKFERAISVNLVGTFNVIRLAAMKMSQNDPNEEGERGVIINTASIAAFDGQQMQLANAPDFA